MADEQTTTPMSLREAFNRLQSGPQKQRRRLEDEAERILQRAVQAEEVLGAAERAVTEAKQRQAAAEQEAPRILDGARAEAKQIVGDARREAERIRGDVALLESDKGTLTGEVAELAAQKAALADEVQQLAGAKAALSGKRARVGA